MKLKSTLLAMLLVALVVYTCRMPGIGFGEVSVADACECLDDCIDDEEPDDADDEDEDEGGVDEEEVTEEEEEEDATEEEEDPPLEPTPEDEDETCDYLRADILEAIFILMDLDDELDALFEEQNALLATVIFETDDPPTEEQQQTWDEIDEIGEEIQNINALIDINEHLLDQAEQAFDQAGCDCDC